MVKITDSTLEALTQWAVTTGLRLLLAILVLFIGWWVTRLLVKALKNILLKSRVDPGAASFIASVARVILWFITIVTALGQLEVNLTSMVTALGAAGLTASFALQGSLGNFVSGMQVIFSKPFGVGDFLQVDTFSGTVKAITVLNTTLITPDNKDVIIPNSVLTSGIVINFTAQKSRRLDLSYSVSYETDTEVPKQILREMVEKNEKILQDPAPIIAVGAHNPGAVEIVAKIWVGVDDYWDIYFAMQEEVKKAFDKASVTMPFPQLDVHMKEKELSQ